MLSLLLPSGWFECNDTPQVNVYSTEAGLNVPTVPNMLSLPSMSFCWKSF